MAMMLHSPWLMADQRPSGIARTPGHWLHSPPSSGLLLATTSYYLCKLGTQEMWKIDPFVAVRNKGEIARALCDLWRSCELPVAVRGWNLKLHRRYTRSRLLRMTCEYWLPNSPLPKCFASMSRKSSKRWSDFLSPHKKDSLGSHMMLWMFGVCVTKNVEICNRIIQQVDLVNLIKIRY